MICLNTDGRKRMIQNLHIHRWTWFYSFAVLTFSYCLLLHCAAITASKMTYLPTLRLLTPWAVCFHSSYSAYSAICLKWLSSFCTASVSKFIVFLSASIIIYTVCLKGGHISVRSFGIIVSFNIWSSEIQFRWFKIIPFSFILNSSAICLTKQFLQRSLHI